MSPKTDNSYKIKASYKRGKLAQRDFRKKLYPLPPYNPVYKTRVLQPFQGALCPSPRFYLQFSGRHFSSYPQSLLAPVQQWSCLGGAPQKPPFNTRSHRRIASVTALNTDMHRTGFSFQYLLEES